MRISVPNLTPIRRAGRHGEAAFTMIEVAMSLAIVAFAMVAIMGVMPTGLNVQRQNREETVISQDASFLMEAIKSGDTGRYLDIIASNLRSVHRTNVYNGQLFTNFWDVKLTGGVPAPETGEILGYICRPRSFETPDGLVMNYTNRLRFKGFSGNMATLAPQFNDVFEYEVESVVSQITGKRRQLGETTSFVDSFVGGNLYSVKLVFRWPILPTGEVGTGEKEFVTQMTGYLNTKLYVTNDNSYTNFTTNALTQIEWQTKVGRIANIGVEPNLGFVFEDELIRAGTY